jgi:hypothetical protein
MEVFDNAYNTNSDVPAREKGKIADGLIEPKRVEKVV